MLCDLEELTSPLCSGFLIDEVGVKFVPSEQLLGPLLW